MPSPLSLAPGALPSVPGRVLRSPRVLLLDADAAHAATLAEQLAADDLDVVLADDDRMAASRLRNGAADLAIVSAEFPCESGYAVVDRLREAGVLSTECPVLAISARAEPLDRLRALNRGCVDFLALPLFYPELHARIELALTRVHSAAERLTRIDIAGGLQVDLHGRRAIVNGQSITLAPKLWELLVLLAAQPDRVVPKAEALKEIWGYAATARTRTVDSHACRLRTALREAGGDYVHNQWGYGYRLTRPGVVAL